MIEEIQNDESLEPDNKGLENVSGGMEHEWGPGRRLGSRDEVGCSFPNSPQSSRTPPQNPEGQQPTQGFVRPRGENIVRRENPSGVSKKRKRKE